jgi:hypothetical protein
MSKRLLPAGFTGYVWVMLYPLSQVFTSLVLDHFC